ncbi:mitochondrial carrier domain-containing protein [Myxozyma melibiosi]|uniref:Mitochondrial carrier domain-containing protein n=1 Tax=Myxozyma melibiosi TaxID=54550 RepID=A0ABR1F1G8_9ASCO
MASETSKTPLSSETIPPRQSSWRLNMTAIHAVSGATAGFLTGFFVCPLDVARTKLQAKGGFTKYGVKGADKYLGLTGTMQTIWKTEGVAGFYRGLGTTTVGYLPTLMVYFTVYEQCKKDLPRFSGASIICIMKKREAHRSIVFREYPSFMHMASAFTGGVIATVITSPITVVKTRLMTQSAHTAWHYRDSFDAFKTMYRTEGLSSFYSGLVPSLYALVHVSIQFPLYESFKKVFVPAPESKPSDFEKISAVFTASTLAKMLTSSVTYPFEVIKTRMQIQRVLAHASPSSSDKPASAAYDGIMKTVRSIFVDEGWRTFYAGMGTNLLRTIPASAVTLITYEVMTDKLGKWQR